MHDANEEELATAKRRVEELRARIEHHSYRYYVLDAPERLLRIKLPSAAITKSHDVAVHTAN